MQDKLNNYKQNISKKLTILKRKSINLSIIRFILFLLFMILTFTYIKQNKQYIIYIMLILFILFILSIIKHTSLNKQIKQYTLKIEIINNYLNKNINNTSIQTHTDFFNDLDLSSLFHYLNYTNTKGGYHKLLDALLLKDIKDITLKQQAIKELTTNYKFIITFQSLLKEIPHINKIDLKTLLNSKIKKDNTLIYLIISIVLSLSTILSLLFIRYIPYLIFIILVIIQILYSYIITLKYDYVYNTINESINIYSKLKPIYTYINKQNFNTQLNKDLQTHISNGLQFLKQLSLISTFDSFRLNFITNLILNIFASLNFITLYSYFKLMNINEEIFIKSISSLEDFEVNISFSTISLLKKDITLPIVNNESTIDIKDIKHPLIDEDKCISNNFNSSININLITGSNMSGKTAFMKTIAINLILAYNGSFVNASYFNVPIAKLYTSINVKDDIEHGISTFYGELSRIKNILDTKDNHLKIIFIDEIFKGTNYNDRIIGAKEVIRKLSQLNCIVFLTTHDFELCEIENVINYHFSEQYINEKIIFDHKIKKGRCTTTNALYLMKKLGILSKES